jgi:hypothetical protein
MPALRDPRAVTTYAEEASMDEETFNMSVRKFLKKLGVTAQREIELRCASNSRPGICAATRDSRPRRRSLSMV